MIRIILICIFIFSVLPFQITAQQEPPELIQLSGVVNDQYNQPLPFVHIKVLNRRQGTITDQNGIFSFISQPFDTIRFSSVGYKPAVFILPDSLPDPHLTIDVYMAPDTILMEEAVIYPWKTYEEFKEAFLALELPEDDYERARKNIAIIQTQILLSDEPVPGQSFKYVMQEQYEQTMMQGMAYPVIKLFDPLAWGRFVKALKDGEFKKKD